MERLGTYCSYCERRGYYLHVEHVVPKTRRSDLEEDWNNFLLGCVNCNSIKGNRNRGRDGYVWPDRDDTHMAFEYLPEGTVRVRATLPDDVAARAARLCELVGLDRTPGVDPTASDLRWSERRRAWAMAVNARERMLSGADRRLVVELAKATGFWSVWTTVFADDPQMCAHFSRAFPGTRTAS